MISTPLPPPTPTLGDLGVVLRFRTPQDAAFLEAVYFAYRWDEVAQTGWPEAARIAFLSDQYRMQCRHYDEHYPDAAYAVVEENGRAVGRLYTLFSAGDLRIMDIGLMPDARDRGLGQALLEAVLLQAETLRADKVSIHVEQSNPARRLYDRLGFSVADASGVYYRLERPVGPMAAVSL